MTENAFLAIAVVSVAAAWATVKVHGASLSHQRAKATAAAKAAKGSTP